MEKVQGLSQHAPPLFCGLMTPLIKERLNQVPHHYFIPSTTPDTYCQTICILQGFDLFTVWQSLALADDLALLVQRKTEM